MTTQRFQSRKLLSLCVAGWCFSGSLAPAQNAPPLSANSGSGQPMVTHIHHHYYYPNPSSPMTMMASYYSPTYAWNYGYQPGSGTVYSPWNQNWGHLGFTGYIGQHGGGVDITPESLNVFTGL